MKCITETIISMLDTWWFWYKVIWVISFVLLFFRDDIVKIYQTISLTISTDLPKGVFHLLTIAIFLPITLPFTLANILNRCL